ncbi:MAG: isochorismatase family protein [Treponema sp.]|nr:isochorismatase family protein [Treponema sp.]
MSRKMFMALLTVTALGLRGVAAQEALPRAGGSGVLDEWSSVKAPPPPPLTELRLDPRNTALLVLDMQHALVDAASRPRAAAAVPAFAALLARARGAGAFVAYSTIPRGTSADIFPELAPAAGEPVVHAGVDKFFGTELDAILKSRGIRTLIVTGTVANGAVLFTATEAALRGYKVVVPVDCMPAADPYAEQFTAWQLVNGPGTRNAAVLVRSEGIGF